MPSCQPASVVVRSSWIEPFSPISPPQAPAGVAVVVAAGGPGPFPPAPPAAGPRRRGGRREGGEGDADRYEQAGEGAHATSDDGPRRPVPAGSEDQVAQPDDERDEQADAEAAGEHGAE